MNTMPIDQTSILIITATLAAIFFVLFIYQLIETFKLKRQPEKILEDTQDKSYQLLSEAIKKAENIVAIAELQGLKITAQSKLATQTSKDKYASQLEEITQQSATSLSSTVAKTQTAILKTEQDFKIFVQSLNNQASSATSDNKQLLEQKINTLFETFEQHMSDFLTQTQQQSVKAIDLEMQAARQLIQTYKQQQFNLIDENIVAMLEQTLSLVLAKKLTLKDQTDLIYESLEKAKAEKFII